MTADDKWTKDKTKNHFEGVWMKVIWPIIKIASLITIFMIFKYVAEISTLYSVLVCVTITLSYQHVIAMKYKDVFVMPAMDHQSYISSPNSFVNYMNLQQYIGYDEDAVIGMFKKYITDKQPKFRYKIKEIAGDYYYEMMSLEETFEKLFISAESPDKVLTNQKEVD
jgi:hypothetical protein